MTVLHDRCDSLVIFSVLILVSSSAILFGTRYYLRLESLATRQVCNWADPSHPLLYFSPPTTVTISLQLICKWSSRQRLSIAPLAGASAFSRVYSASYERWLSPGVKQAAISLGRPPAQPLQMSAAQRFSKALRTKDGMMSRARVYADVNTTRPKEYWDYENMTLQWGCVNVHTPLMKGWCSAIAFKMQATG